MMPNQSFRSWGNETFNAMNSCYVMSLIAKKLKWTPMLLKENIQRLQGEYCPNFDRFLYFIEISSSSKKKKKKKKKRGYRKKHVRRECTVCVERPWIKSSSDIIIDFEQKYVTTGNLWPLTTYFWEVTKYMYFLNWLFRVPRKRTVLEFWGIPREFWIIMIIIIQVSRQLFFSFHVQIRCTFWLLLLLIKMLFSKVRNGFTMIIWKLNTFSCNLWF